MHRAIQIAAARAKKPAFGGVTRRGQEQEELLPFESEEEWAAAGGGAQSVAAPIFQGITWNGLANFNLINQFYRSLAIGDAKHDDIFDKDNIIGGFPGGINNVFNLVTNSSTFNGSFNEDRMLDTYYQGLKTDFKGVQNIGIYNNRPVKYHTFKFPRGEIEGGVGEGSAAGGGGAAAPTLERKYVISFYTMETKRGGNKTSDGYSGLLNFLNLKIPMFSNKIVLVKDFHTFSIDRALNATILGGGAGTLLFSANLFSRADPAPKDYSYVVGQNPKTNFGRFGNFNVLYLDEVPASIQTLAYPTSPFFSQYTFTHMRNGTKVDIQITPPPPGGPNPLIIRDANTNTSKDKVRDSNYAPHMIAAKRAGDQLNALFCGRFKDFSHTICNGIQIPQAVANQYLPIFLTHDRPALLYALSLGMPVLYSFDSDENGNKDYDVVVGLFLPDQYAQPKSSTVKLNEFDPPGQNFRATTSVYKDSLLASLTEYNTFLVNLQGYITSIIQNNQAGPPISILADDAGGEAGAGSAAGGSSTSLPNPPFISQVDNLYDYLNNIHFVAHMYKFFPKAAHINRALLEGKDVPNIGALATAADAASATPETKKAFDDALKYFEELKKLNKFIEIITSAPYNTRLNTLDISYSYEPVMTRPLGAGWPKFSDLQKYSLANKNMYILFTQINDGFSDNTALLAAFKGFINGRLEPNPHFVYSFFNSDQIASRDSKFSREYFKALVNSLDGSQPYTISADNREREKYLKAAHDAAMKQTVEVAVGVARGRSQSRSTAAGSRSGSRAPSASAAPRPLVGLAAAGGGGREDGGVRVVDRGERPAQSIRRRSPTPARAALVAVEEGTGAGAGSGAGAGAEEEGGGGGGRLSAAARAARIEQAALARAGVAQSPLLEEEEERGAGGLAAVESAGSTSSAGTRRRRYNQETAASAAAVQAAEVEQGSSEAKRRNITQREDRKTPSEAALQIKKIRKPWKGGRRTRRKQHKPTTEAIYKMQRGGSGRGLAASAAAKAKSSFTVNEKVYSIYEALFNYYDKTVGELYLQDPYFYKRSIVEDIIDAMNAVNNSVQDITEENSTEENNAEEEITKEDIKKINYKHLISDPRASRTIYNALLDYFGPGDEQVIEVLNTELVPLKHQERLIQIGKNGKAVEISGSAGAAGFSEFVAPEELPVRSDIQRHNDILYTAIDNYADLVNTEDTRRKSPLLPLNQGALARYLETAGGSSAAAEEAEEEEEEERILSDVLESLIGTPPAELRAAAAAVEPVEVEMASAAKGEELEGAAAKPNGFPLGVAGGSPRHLPGGGGVGGASQDPSSYIGSLGTGGGGGTQNPNVGAASLEKENTGLEEEEAEAAKLRGGWGTPERNPNGSMPSTEVRGGIGVPRNKLPPELLKQLPFGAGSNSETSEVSMEGTGGRRRGTKTRRNKKRLGKNKSLRKRNSKNY